MILFEKSGKEKQYGRFATELTYNKFSKHSIFSNIGIEEITGFDNVRLSSTGLVQLNSTDFYVEKTDLLRIEMINISSTSTAETSIGFWNEDESAYLVYRGVNNCTLAIKRSALDVETTYSVGKVKMSTTKPKVISVSLQVLDQPMISIMINGFVAHQLFLKDIGFNFSQRLFIKSSVSQPSTNVFLTFSEAKILYQKSI